MAKIVIGMFEPSREGEAVVRELNAAGFSQDEVQVISSRPETETGPPLGGPLEDIGTESGIGMGTATASATYPSSVMRSLCTMGVPEDQAEEYAEGIRRGGMLVIVRSPDERLDAAADLMDMHGAVRVDERAAQWMAAGWKRQFPRATDDSGMSPHHRQPDTVQVGRDRTEAGGARVFVW